MQYIKHKGRKIPYREFLVIFPGETTHTAINISSESVEDSLDLNNKADAMLDESIYFYVQDDVFEADAKEICEGGYLDEVLIFVEEVNG